jgi:predicted glutamine amidotransferase
MCRILYALNQPNIKSKINSFLLQSTDEPKAVDGHGFAGFDPTTRKWRVKKSSKPAPGSESKIANTFAEYPLVIGHLRNAQIVDVPKSVIDGPLSASPKNTHPFYHKNHVFMHNGRFDDAHLPSMRQWFHANILPEYWQHVKGNTDSECVFYLLLSTIKRREWIYKDIDMLEGEGCILPTRFQRNLSSASLVKSSYSFLFESGILRKSHSKSEELRDAVRECFQLLDSKFHLYIANFIYADKDYSIVGRLEKNATAQGKLVDSLYMATPSQRKNNQLLFTTEPLDKTQKYELVNWGTIFVVNNETAEYNKYRI